MDIGNIEPYSPLYNQQIKIGFFHWAYDENNDVSDENDVKPCKNYDISDENDVSPGKNYDNYKIIKWR